MKMRMTKSLVLSDPSCGRTGPSRRQSAGVHLQKSIGMMRRGKVGPLLLTFLTALEAGAEAGAETDLVRSLRHSSSQCNQTEPISHL
jgi:hypothetical protein